MSSPTKQAKASPTKKDKTSKTILVTGGTGLFCLLNKKRLRGKINPQTAATTQTPGLVGMGIQEALETRKLALKQPEETWIFLSSKDCDLLSMDKTRELFRKHQPTHVIHLAAKVGGLYANQSQKVEFYRENTIMNDVIMVRRGLGDWYEDELTR